MKRTYSIDRPRARFVFSSLLAKLKKLEHPFDHSTLPQVEKNMPSNLTFGGVEHALFLWASCYYMRGGIDSEVAFRRLTLVHERKPYLFDPKWFFDQIPERIKGGSIKNARVLARYVRFTGAFKELSKELDAHGLGFSLKDNTRFWVLNAVKLHMHWKGNPMLMFAGVATFDKLVVNIANKNKFSILKPGGFLGFQEKMVSMIAYFFGATKLLDLEKLPVPVDFHVLRIMVSTGILVPNWEVKKDGNIFSPELLAAAREVTLEYCVQHDVEMVDLCNALWIYSRAMCSWHPDTRSKTPEKSHKRKVQQMLRKDPRRILALTAVDRPQEEFILTEFPKSLGRKSKVIHVQADWSSGAQLAAFDRACALCPIQTVCTKSVPAAPYYLKGEVQYRERTVPVGKRFLFDAVDMSIRINVVPWDKEASRKDALIYLGLLKPEKEEIQEHPVLAGLDVEPSKKQELLLAPVDKTKAA